MLGQYGQITYPIFVAGRLKANVGNAKDKVTGHPGVLDGISCDCPDDCDQTLYSQVGIQSYD